MACPAGCIIATKETSHSQIIIVIVITNYVLFKYLSILIFYRDFISDEQFGLIFSIFTYSFDIFYMYIVGLIVDIFSKWLVFLLTFRIFQNCFCEPSSQFSHFSFLLKNASIKHPTGFHIYLFKYNQSHTFTLPLDTYIIHWII